MLRSIFNPLGSGQVKVVAALDVEHEVPSVQVLHHEEQVLLVGTHTGRDTKRGLTQWSDHFLVFSAEPPFTSYTSSSH